ncbi:MAG: hypothetical protein ABSH03_20765 [Candidatus Lustribacter sp.]|jgi:hypothetical protein
MAFKDAPSTLLGTPNQELGQRLPFKRSRSFEQFFLAGGWAEIDSSFVALTWG